MPEQTMISVTPIQPGVALHAAPDLLSPRIACTDPGDLFDLLRDPEAGLAAIGRYGQWLMVRSWPDRLYGWLPAWQVAEAVAATPGQAPLTLRDRAPALWIPAVQSPPEGAAAVPPPDPAPGEAVYVRTPYSDGLNLRAGPAIGYARVSTARKNERLRLLGDPAEGLARLGRMDQWVAVEKSGGSRGWVAALFLEPAPVFVSAAPGHALAGLHGPADPGKWPWDEGAFEILREARLPAVKLLAWGDMDGDVVQRLRACGVRFVMARLFARFAQVRSETDFVEEVEGSLRALYGAGVRYFEVHNEPNLHHEGSPEGMWVQWQGGKQFGEFLLRVLRILRPRYPEARFGWPGLSPGADLADGQGRPLRYDSARFLEEADYAVRSCDFICMHSYWGPDGFERSLAEIEAYCQRYPDKEIIVSEFSNSDPGISKDIKGEQYGRFYTEAALRLPPNLVALFSFVLSASSGFGAETWRGSSIASQLARHTL